MDQFGKEMVIPPVPNPFALVRKINYWCWYFPTRFGLHPRNCVLTIHLSIRNRACSLLTPRRKTAS